MKERNGHGCPPNAGVTLVELGAIIALTAIIVLLLLPWTRWSAEASRNACAENLKQMGLIFKIYADESPGNLYPLKSPHGMAPDIATLYPDYINDLALLVCPSVGDYSLNDPNNPEGWYGRDGKPRLARLRRSADVSYHYLGFAIPNNAWIDPPLSVAPLIQQAFAHPGADVEWTDHPNPNVGDVTLYRIHRGVERILAAEGHMVDGEGARLPVMWDALTRVDNIVKFNHPPDGSLVLFLDGHVKFVEYGFRFPITEEYASLGLGT